MTTAYAPDRLELESLVRSAVDGDREAWTCLVDEFNPLVLSVVRRYRMSQADAEEVGQAVWLKLLENLHRIRIPAALPGWIVTTTQRQALQTLKSAGRAVSLEANESLISLASVTADHPDAAENLLLFERVEAVRAALAEITEVQRELLLLLVADPPLSYEQISQRIQIPIGSIGPTRGRLLKKLRETTAMRSYRNN